MELTLKLLSGRNSGKEIQVSHSKFLIGRADDCHLRPHSDLVSRHHCVLLVEEGFCAIRDFGSRNGTYVNEQRIVGQQELHNGDKVKVGVLEFEIELTSRVGGKKKPKVKDIKDVAQRTASAASQGGDDDDDISDWLSDEHDISETRKLDLPERQPPHETPNAASQPARDTVFMKKSPTEETTTAKPLKPEEPATEKESEAKSDSEQGGADTAKRLFGKRGPGAQKGSANSRDAAADALKKFFNTRKP